MLGTSWEFDLKFKWSWVKDQMSACSLLFPKAQEPKKHENGNILVASLLMLLVMNLLGIGLANLSVKEWNMASYKTIDSQIFNMSESCAQNVVAWFGTQQSTPATPLGSSGYASSNTGYTAINNKLSGYSFNCTTAYITTRQATSRLTSGSEIGNSDGKYGGTGTQVPKDYYKIVSTGSGPKNSSKVTNTIISVEY